MTPLTQREFLYLDDAINATQMEAKFFAELAQMAQEPAVKDLCNAAAQMHQRHYDRLARYMQASQGQGQGQSHQAQQPWMQGQQAQATFGYPNQGGYAQSMR